MKEETITTTKASCLLLALNVLAMMLYTATVGKPELIHGQRPPFVETTNLVENIEHRRLRSYDVAPLSEQLHEFEHAFDEVEKRIMTAAEIQDYRKQHGMNPSDPIIYFITPTYKRITQMVDLIRLSQTLMSSHQIYWIVVEDAPHCSQRVRDLLDRTGLMYSHFAKHPPESARGHRGIHQRNDALDLIDSLDTPGVVFFGDDDNAFDARLFEELPRTSGVSIFGVGFTGQATYQRCVVDPNTGKVDHIATNWAPNREFPMDMAGFSFHTSVLREKKPRFSDSMPAGKLETSFLSLMVSKQSDLQALNDGCKRIYAWHAKTLPQSEQPGDLPLHDEFAPYVAALL